MSNSIINPPPADLVPDNRGKTSIGVVVGTTTAVVFGLGGFFLLNDKTGAMGSVLFMALPLATGFATALVVRGKKLAASCLFIGLLICTAVLLMTRMEGWVCVLMSAPLIAVGLAFGALLGVLFRWQVIEKFQKQQLGIFLTLAILPFFLMGANSAEEQSRRTLRAETIANTFVTDAPREVVWNQLKTFDRIKGSKGLLMTIGLPVPVSCTMSGEGVGATRTCYFEQGHIQERVTEWNPPSSMKLEITEFDVPGRPWLSFKDASYELTTEGGRTVVTRKTTIVSRLSPAWYWRPLEKIGVETEHEYLFAEVKRKIEAAK
jgi:hypothetical protein